MMSAAEEVYRAACWFAGGRYDGVQTRGERRWLVVTDDATQSTCYVPLDAAFTTSRVLAKLQECRRRFGR